MLLYSTPTRVNVYNSIHDRLLFAIVPPSLWRAKSIDYTGHTWAILLAKLRTTTDVLQLDVFSSLVKLITCYVPTENLIQLLKNSLLYKFCYIYMVMLLGIYCILKLIVSAQLGASHRSKTDLR